MKKLVTSYIFDASACTITSDDFQTLDGILLITNVTDNIIIYNFTDSSCGGSLVGTTLTLNYNTSSMSDTDRLQIFIDNAEESVTKELADALFELVARLDFLPAVRGIAADIRVTPTTTPNMSTLTTLTGQTNIGGYNAANMVMNSQNNLATIANINNIGV